MQAVSLTERLAVHAPAGRAPSPLELSAALATAGLSHDALLAALDGRDATGPLSADECGERVARVLDALATVAPVGLVRPATVAPLALHAWLTQATGDRAALVTYLARLDGERASVAADIAALELAIGRIDPASAQAAGIEVSRRLLAAVAPAGPAEGTRHNRPALAACLTALEKAAYHKHGPALACLLAACDTVLSGAGERSPADYDLPPSGDRAGRANASAAARQRWSGAGLPLDALDELTNGLAGRVVNGARRGVTAADIVALVRDVDGGETATEAARRVVAALA